MNCTLPVHTFCCLALAALLSTPLRAAEVIPHAQDKPPNEPRDAATAARMMTVPEGFVVDVVASEPDVVNPVAMAIDEQGRFWITESLEYPRRSPGPGKDRVKLLVDTDGDGRVDKTSIFLDGLNIPSGVQVGHGGVWVANAPDILFVPDANRDGIADGPAQVVVTGFGRTDTHELPNSLTWGPDGWLYGLNGVFNHSHVKYPPENPNYTAEHPGWPLTCALFRIHPRTRAFEVFCEGTSNPWGVAFNDEGDAFVSACVIDHLWHLVENGYYHRQGGPYPPHTWKIESIVKHKHQKAAYCGITWFDSDAYPEQYRKKLYMGNIHGGCINVDRIERNGSTYAGFGEPDFLTANDSWFMPVVQKTGPDGCLYVLDWYDRYHCYQDANRDPEGIDRLKGRLYRVRYTGETGATQPQAVMRDLGAESDDALIGLLGDPNIWRRETAQRLLQERNSEPVITQLLQTFVPDAPPVSPVARRHRLWTLLGCDLLQHPPAYQLPHQLILSSDPVCRAWAARCIALHHLQSPQITELEQMDAAGILFAALEDEAPEVRLQAAIAIGRYAQRSQHYVSYSEALAQAVVRAPEDLHFARIVWQTLKPLMADHPAEARTFLAAPGLDQTDAGQELQARIVDWLLTRPEFDPQPLADLFDRLRDDPQQRARPLLKSLAAKVQSGELKGEKLDQLKAALADSLKPMLGVASTHPLRLEASLLALSWSDPGAVGTARSLTMNRDESPARRLAAYNALIAAQDGCVEQVARTIFARVEQEPPQFVGDVLAALGRSERETLGEAVVKYLPSFPVDVQPRAVELLTQRPAWAKELLEAMGDKQIPASMLNVNQARKLNESKDAEVRELLHRHWGVVREGRSSDRDQVISAMRNLIRKTPGDEQNGAAVFKKLCAQCHKIYGEGAEVGPDITLNGRNDYTQLLSNVFDPSLVIGSGYRAFTVATQDGRVLNGLLVEDSPQRIVLKVQGGKQEIIARDDIDELKVSEVSLMPEQVERQLAPQEIADLFAFLTLDKPPSDPAGKRLPGVYDVVPRASTNPADFAAIAQEVAPGFTEVRSGEGGVALLAEHQGRTGVLRTHPVSRDQPGLIAGEFTLPAEKKSKLVVDVSHDRRGDWRLVVSAEGRIIDELVSADTCGPDGWATYTASLEKFAGKKVRIVLLNQANDWAYEFAYWGRIAVVLE